MELCRWTICSKAHFMNSSSVQSSKAYRRSFIFFTVVGAVMLLLAIAAQIFEALFVPLRGQLVWGFLPACLICWFIASLHYSKYLSLTASSQSSVGRVG